MADSETTASTEMATGIKIAQREAPTLTISADIEEQIEAHIEKLCTATKEEIEAAIAGTKETAVARLFLSAFEPSGKAIRGEVRTVYEQAQQERDMRTPFHVAFNNAKKSTPFLPFKVKEDLGTYGHADSDKWTLLFKNTPTIKPDKIPEVVQKMHNSAAKIGEQIDDPKSKIILLSLCHQYLGVDIAKIAKALDQKPDEVIALIDEINTKKLNDQTFEIQIRNGIAILVEKKVRIVAIDNMESRERFAKQDRQIADIVETIQAKTRATAPPDAEQPKTFEEIIRDNVDTFPSGLDYRIALECAYDHDNGDTGLTVDEISYLLGEETGVVSTRMQNVKAALQSIGLNIRKKINGNEGVYVLTKFDGNATPTVTVPLPATIVKPERQAIPSTRQPEVIPPTTFQDTVSRNRPAFMGNNVLYEIARQLARESDKGKPGSTAEELALKHGITYRRMQELLTPLKEVLRSIGLQLSAKPYKGKIEYSIGRGPSIPVTGQSLRTGTPAETSVRIVPTPTVSAVTPTTPTAPPAKPATPIAPPALATLSQRASLNLVLLEGKTFKDAQEANTAIMGALKPVILSGHPLTIGTIAALRGALDRIVPLQHSDMQSRLQRYVDKLRRAEQKAKNGIITDHHLTEIYTGVQ